MVPVYQFFLGLYAAESEPLLTGSLKVYPNRLDEIYDLTPAIVRDSTDHPAYRMKQKFALVMSLIALVSTYLVLEAVAGFLNVPFWVEGTGELVRGGGGREAYDTEDSGALVGLGLYALVACPLLARRVYCWIADDPVNDRWSVNTTANWWGWFGGASVYAGSAVILQLLDLGSRVTRVADVGLLVAAFFVGWRIYEGVKLSAEGI